jgi:hypothetical protein
MIVPIKSIISAEYAVKWFSKGLELRFPQASESYFFFGFKKDSVFECYEKLHEIMRNSV